MSRIYFVLDAWIEDGRKLQQESARLSRYRVLEGSENLLNYTIYSWVIYDVKNHDFQNVIKMYRPEVSFSAAEKMLSRNPYKH